MILKTKNNPIGISTTPNFHITGGSYQSVEHEIEFTYRRIRLNDIKYFGTNLLLI
jgi:hypothetical protein